MAAPCRPFSRTCPEPGCTFKTFGASKKSVVNNMYRHIREQHGDGDALERRRSQQRERVAVARCAIAPAGPPCSSDMMAFVTCPRHRDRLWSQALGRLCATGVPASKVHRRFGIDWHEYLRASGESDRRQRDVPLGLKRHTFLMYDFHRHFLPSCEQAFQQDGELKVVYWVEDDITFPKGTAFRDIHALALGHASAPAGPCLSWLGFTKVRGKARYGSHLVAVHREGVAALKAHLDCASEDGKEGGNLLSYLKGLDTFLCEGCSTRASGVATGRLLAQASTQSMASQLKDHAFVGRR